MIEGEGYQVAVNGHIKVLSVFPEQQTLPLPPSSMSMEKSLEK